MGKLQKEHEARAESSDLPHDAPPAYVDTNTADTSTPDDDAPPPGYTPGPSPYEKVPVGWNLYYKTWSLRTFLLGPHADQPRFALSLHSAILSSRPFLILFDGPDTKSSPQLATAHREGMIRGHSRITVPSRPGSASPTVTEKMTAKTTRFRFSFNVGRGKDTRREDFEWRYSHGKEVKVLDRWSLGWKLVHLGPSDGASLSQTSTAGSGSTSRSQRPHGEASDGNPIVAVFADNSKLSKNKLAKFHFVGAGATDEFGEDWALYVTMSALRIWELTMNSGTSSAGS